MSPLLLALLLAAPAPAQDSALASLFQKVSSYLNQGPVRNAPRRAAVAAVRGGIPTDQGEDLDQRLLDRARALRAALLGASPSPADASALRKVHEALAASQWVQALSLAGAPEVRADAAAQLSAWARGAAIPDAARRLLTGPASRIDDKALVAAGWPAHVRALSPARPAPRAAAPGFEPSEEVRRLDESIKSVKSSWLEKTIPPEAEAKAHALAGHLYLALAKADLTGRPAATAAAEEASPPEEEEAPRAPAGPKVEFDPRAVYRMAAPSVVFILCAGEDGNGEIGTGSFISGGRILTNAHVVIRDSTRKPWPSVKVFLKPRKMTGDPKRDLQGGVEARVTAWDNALDLAVIEASLPSAPPALELGDPEAVDVGDRVAAIGHPEQGGLWTLTTGVVSTLVADLGGVKGKAAFQTDASINRGNSGGPLLDASGRIVGVNTLMSRKAADGLAITAVNFSVRSDVARRWLAAKAGTALAYGRAAAMTAPPPSAAPPVRAMPPTVPASAPLSRKPARAPPPARAMVTESKPFDMDRLMEEQMKEMEDLEGEMRDELRKKAGR